MTDTTNTERLVTALKDVLDSIANKCPPCQGDLVHPCVCLDCSTERAHAALAEAEGQAVLTDAVKVLAELVQLECDGNASAECAIEAWERARAVIAADRGQG